MILNGRSDRTRTYNPRFWRPVLYQLSYTPTVSSTKGYSDFFDKSTKEILKKIYYNSKFLYLFACLISSVLKSDADLQDFSNSKKYDLLFDKAK